MFFWNSVAFSMIQWMLASRRTPCPKGGGQEELPHVRGHGVFRSVLFPSIWGFSRHISGVDFQFNYMMVTKHYLVKSKKISKVCFITRTWFVLVNVPCAFEKEVPFLLSRYSIYNVSKRSTLLMILFSFVYLTVLHTGSVLKVLCY